MLSALVTLLISTPISVHTNLPAELMTALGQAIERQTGSEPEMTQHRADEDVLDLAEHARLVRASTRAATVLIVRFDARVGRIEAHLIDRTGRPIQTFNIEVARGESQAQISLDALVRAAFPKLDRPLAQMIDTDDDRPVPKTVSLETESAPAHGSFELTVEVDGRPLRR